MGADTSSLSDHELELMNEYMDLMRDKVHRYVVCGFGSAGKWVTGTAKDLDYETRKHQDELDRLCQQDLEDLEEYCRKIEEDSGVHILQEVRNSTAENPLTVSELMKELTKMILETALIDAHLVLYFTGNSEAKTGNWCLSDGCVSFNDLVDLVRKHRRNNYLMVYVVSDCNYSGAWVDENHKLIGDNKAEDPFIRVLSSCPGNRTSTHRMFAQAFWGKQSAAQRSLLYQTPMEAFETPFKLPELNRKWFADNGTLEQPPFGEQVIDLHWHTVVVYGDEYKLREKRCVQCEVDDCLLFCRQCSWRLCANCVKQRECVIKTFPNGDKYEGAWKDGEFHGTGTLVCVLDKEQYDGTWRYGVKHGTGKYAYANGDFYDGDWDNGLRSGTGSLVTFRGDKYTGAWVADLRNGEGVCKYSNGDRYEGPWVDDLRSGWGVYTYRNGNQYVGPWVDDQRSGQAEYIYRNGDKFEGEYRHDKRCGFGVLNCVNGDHYEGSWEDDHKCGQGVQVYHSRGAGNGDYEGQWKAGHEHGDGIFRYTCGDVYRGGWAGGGRSGKGCQEYANGERYEGEWSMDMFHGQGEFWYKDGSKYDGEWAKGQTGGHGYKYYSNGDQYEGCWANGLYHNQGTKLWADGRRYDGEWRKGIRHGKGRYRYISGETYQGDWEDDRAHGCGEYVFTGGKRFVGQFRDDEMDGEGCFIFPNGDSYSGVWTHDKRNPGCTEKKFYRSGDRYVAKWDKGRRIVL